MSFPIILLIMLGCGLLGGLINYILPANENTDTGKKIRPGWQCMILGIGATLLVPLFLEIAQSKLLDSVYFSFDWQKPADSTQKQVKPDTVRITKFVDSIKKLEQSDTSKTKKAATTPYGETAEAANAGKNYLIYLAYCLVAAAAGFRFINMLINNVVKDQQISKQQSQITNLKKSKEKREQNSQASQQIEDEKVRQEIAESRIKEVEEKTGGGPEAARAQVTALLPLPALPPVTHPDDPQKDRFGGSPKRNGRTLKATVSKSFVPNFYNVSIWVESDDPGANPLNADVIFYLHDSFSPSVYRIPPSEFKDNKAVDDEILSYGAFTVGAITDDGKTMLELDLAEDSSFPKQFRER
jgi:hypothetical protein